jgi:threonine/homoserine/homoserine lactone efflux protein
VITFFKAILLGFSVAAPVGPIGILCIRRTLADGRRVGLACGLGAATADALYGLIAGLGLAAVSAVLVGFRAPMALGGGAYLGYLGVRTFLSRPGDEAAAVGAGGALRAWVSTFVLTVTNPMTLLSFAAMFAAIAPGGRAAVLVAGVFAGSAAWWLTLSSLVGLLRTRLRPVHLLWINRASGAFLVALALWAIATSVAR